jgi:hypothetical protein
VPVNSQPNLRAFVSLSVLAEEILGLSRARVYELIERGSLPQPIYDIRTKRPMFSREQQEQAMAVRTNGVGIDGSAVIFYRRTRPAPQSPPRFTPARTRQRTSPQVPSGIEDLANRLQALGVAQADEQSVTTAVTELFPAGLDGQQDGDVLRMLFRHFRRRETA